MRIDLELPNGPQTILLDHRAFGRTLTQVLRQENLPLNTRCGERDLCKSCSVEVLVDGEYQSVRACQCVLERDLHVRVPQQALLAYAPAVLSDYRINVPYAYDPILGHEGLGVAIDIGTTTVSLVLVNLENGDVVGRAAGFNKQMHLGDDVLTRINLCYSDKPAVQKLQHAILAETILPLVREALLEAQRPIESIKGYVLAGNTTMLHLALGVDPSPMGVAPFTPEFLEHVVRPAGEIGLEPADAQVHCLPGAAAYIGADITSGMLASGLLYEDGPSMLVDVGTNGEIVLKIGDKMYGCATAAGPAFEGSGLSCGIRAGDGAVAHVSIAEDGKFSSDIIGPEGTRAAGVCGSAYVDVLAQGFKQGLLNRNGRIVTDRVLPENLLQNEYGNALVLAVGQGARKILVAETDIARLLQAKAAIAAGILTLLQRINLSPKDVKTLHLAGGFGMHLNLQNAIDCGLFPGFAADQVQLVGNTALAGAYLSCVDESALDELRRAGKSVEIVELNHDPDFEDTYIDQLAIGE